VTSLRAIDACAADLLARLHAHDRSTYDHCRAVGMWCGLLAKTLKLEPADIEVATLAGTLHDVGKMLTPTEILSKSADLSIDEVEVVRRHPADGGALLAAIPELRSIAPIVRAHHENVDGLGYPGGLAGKRVPYASRIVAVADSFHAMIASRPDRRAVPLAAALDLLRDGRGAQWDAGIVDAMIALVAEKTQRPNRAGDRSRASF